MTNWLDDINSESKRQIAIDFDGVIHSNSSKNPFKPIDPPISGAKSALEYLSSKYEIIIFTCRARKDRPNDGVKTVEAWLEKYGMLHLITEITSIKPRAFAYIDDKGITFSNWEDVLKKL